MVEHVKPWEVRAGDRILGTDMVAEGSGVYAGNLHDLPSPVSIDLQRYILRVRHSNGRVSRLPYTGASTIAVIRKGTE